MLARAFRRNTEPQGFRLVWFVTRNHYAGYGLEDNPDQPEEGIMYLQLDTKSSSYTHTLPSGVG